MNVNQQPAGVGLDYTCIGGVEGIDVWVRHARHPEYWDVQLVFPDSASYYFFDTYLSRTASTNYNQRAAFRELRTVMEPRRSTLYHILLLIKLFAPYMFRGAVNPEITNYMKKAVPT